MFSTYPRTAQLPPTLASPPPAPPHAPAMSQFIVATGSYDATIRIFDATSAKVLAQIVFQDLYVLKLAFSHGTASATSADRLYLVAGGSPRVCVYDVKAALAAPRLASNSRPHEPLFAFAGHRGAITEVGFDPVASKAPPGNLAPGEAPFTFPAFGFSASEDGTLQVWDPLLGQGGARMDATETLLRFQNFAPIQAAVYDVSREVFFTVDQKGRLRAWGRKSGKLICSMRPHAQYDFDFDDDMKETEAVNSGHATWERPKVKEEEEGTGSGKHSVGLPPREVPGRGDDALLRPPVTEKDIDRCGVILQTLELYKNAGELCLVTADTQGGVFIYKVEAMLRDRYAKPYAAWNLLDRPHIVGSPRVYTLKIKASMDGKILICAMSSGVVKVFDLEAVDRYVNVDLPEAQRVKVEKEAADKVAVLAAHAEIEDEADQFVAKLGPMTPKERAIKKQLYITRKMKPLVRTEEVKNTTVPLLKTINSHIGFVWDTAFVGDQNSDYYFFTAGSDMRLFLWHLTSGQPNRYPDHDKNIVCLAIKERARC